MSEKHLADWTSDEVSVWLKQVGLESLIQKFQGEMLTRLFCQVFFWIMQGCLGIVLVTSL